MARPAGFSSDEDEFGGFLSDDDYDLAPAVRRPQVQADVAPVEFTMEQKLNILYFAVMNGNINEVKARLDEGIDVNVKVRDGWTLLLLAASVGNSEIVHELIRRGADVNSNRDKYAALMAVCSCPESTSPASKCLDIVTQLIENGANVNAATRKRKTALMFAASNGNVEIVRKLLTVCNIFTRDNQGWDALFWAVNDNKPKAVEVLLEAGLSFDKIDVRGYTASYYATSQHYEDIIKMLPSQNNNATADMKDNHYHLETIFTEQIVNQKPQLFRDVCVLLYGMKSETLINRFLNIGLLDFLSLNDEKLLQLGITIPYQRNRILTGLYKFHMHLYKQTSLSRVNSGAFYTSMDLATDSLAAIRQLITMQASLRYISSAIYTDHDQELKLIKKIKIKLNNLRKKANQLNSLAEQWHYNNHPVDLITSNYNKRTPRWVKWLAYISIISLATIVVSKVRKH